MQSRARQYCVLVCLYLLAGTSAVLADANIVIKQAPPLPPPSGGVIDVYNISGLYSAINSASSGTTIMIHPGTYTLTSVPQLNRAGVTVRGSTGNRDDIVLVGSGINSGGPGSSDYGFHVNVSNITIADLTISGVRYHGIQIRGENGASNLLIHNVKILNAGERYIKGSTDSVHYTDDVTIEYCWLEQTQEISGHSDNDYIGGVDAMFQHRWRISDCVIKNIHGVNAGGRGGIFLWNNVIDAVIERNLIIGCDRGIAFGNPYNPNGINHSTNGVIRNNFIVRPTRTGNQYAMELCATKNLKVYNNTIYCSNAGYSTIHVYDGRTTGLKFYNNILQGQLFLNHTGGTVTADTAGSLMGYTPASEWFIEPLVGDLRLTGTATAAINQGQVLPEVTDDYFAGIRDSQPDIGGYEVFGPPHVTAVSPALVQMQSKTLPLNLITITFDKNVTINSTMVSVTGNATGTRNDFAFSYDSTSHVATLQWPAGLPNDTYTVTVSDAVAAGGLALDGEASLTNPLLPSGNGTAGGAFSGRIYRLVGDINGNKYVNAADLLLLVASWNKASGEQYYNSQADLDASNHVNVGDLQVLVANWGQSL